MDYIKSEDLVNEYAFGNPTPEEQKELTKNGFVFFSGVQDPETKEWYEMWIK